MRSSTTNAVLCGLALSLWAACSSASSEGTNANGEPAPTPAEVTAEEPLPSPTTVPPEVQAPHARTGPEALTSVTLVFGGDVQFGRVKHGELVLHGPSHPFRELASLFRDADLSIVNLENPLCTHVPKPTERLHPRMRGLPEHAEWLAEGGIDVAVVANNHAADCGLKGAKQTLSALREAGVISAGMRFDGGNPLEPLHFELHGQDVYLYAVTSHLSHRMAWEESVARVKAKHLHEGLAPLIRALRERKPDALIIASLHWGQERQFMPREIQRQQARVLIDAGANLLMGHHPHVIQPVELYQGALVLYSLGNLYFDRKKHALRETFVPRITLEQATDGTWTTKAITLYPVYRKDMRGRVHLAEGDDADRILSHLEELQERLEAPFLERGEANTTLFWARP